MLVTKTKELITFIDFTWSPGFLISSFPSFILYIYSFFPLVSFPSSLLSQNIRKHLLCVRHSATKVEEKTTFSLLWSLHMYWELRHSLNNHQICNFKQHLVPYRKTQNPVRNLVVWASSRKCQLSWSRKDEEELVNYFPCI